MKLRYYLCLLLISSVLISGCVQNGIKNALNWQIKDFKVTNQDNKPFGMKNLKGKIWISDFVFTKCTDICPPMTANMTKLQNRIKAEGLKNVELVSFSVDPTVDSPAKLHSFAKQYGADLKNWAFLTGYSQKFIENFALKNYKTLVKKPDQGDQVIHGIDFYLVGPDGKIKKSYNGYDKTPFDEIINDIKTLQ
ncbi:MAG: SCO family protein [Bacillota bacterium]|nr:SCO family protein [Bacillota bacterium]